MKINSNISPRGFTFIEVLFAIVILGVGMIMIAGMLPVAIKQTSDTRNDLTARVAADSGYAYLRTLANSHPEAFPETNGVYTVGGGDSITPATTTNDLAKFMGKTSMALQDDAYTSNGSFPTNLAAASAEARRRAGRVVPLSYDVVRPDNAHDLTNMNAAAVAAYPLAWHQLIVGNRVVSSEPRFQWLGFYRRDENSNTAKLIIISMRMQSGEAIDHYDAGLTIPNENINALNGPFLVPIEIEDSLTEPDKVKFTFMGANPFDVDVAETGSYLIIAHSPPVSENPVTGDINRPFRNNGRIFKLGARREDLDANAGGARVWELAPGFDLGPAGEGPDGILGTADDVPDGSMNTAASFAENKPPIGTAARQTQVTEYPVSDTTSVAGTTTWAWIIGRGRLDPTSNAVSPHAGATQDLGVLSVDVTLP